jgi:leader peptidase (prepilin peptidase)/N-methyltransferase
MSIGAAIVCALVGVPVGSFLNVAIDQVPADLPLRGPAAEGEPPIRTWAGVPVRPWLLGRRGDGALPSRWLVVEVVTALVFGALGAQYGGSTVVLPLLVLGACLVATSFTDLAHLRIPDRITFPSFAATTAGVVVVSIQHSTIDAVQGAIAGAVAYFLLLFVAHMVSPRGMGWGDVKLALVMGLGLGWVAWRPEETITAPLRLVLQALVVGCILGVVFGLAYRAATQRRDGFPFGPALAAGCLIVLLAAA